MQGIPRDVQQYETAEGACPFRDWLDSLKDRTGRAKIRTRIDRVTVGNFGDHESVGEGVCELRVDYGPAYRIYYAVIDSTIVLLLIGGDKSTQQRDIRTAKEYWRSFKRVNNV